MTRKFPNLLVGVTVILFILTMTGCVKDNCQRTYTLYKPGFKTLAEVRANMKANSPTSLKQTGKIYLYGSYIFLNEMEKGIHIIDNSNPSAPRNIAFVDIPGNVDMAVSGNTLYADSWGDLVTFDISNPTQAVAKSFLSNVFPHRGRYYVAPNNTSNPDSIQVLVGWTTKDTTVDCDSYERLYGMYYAMESADKAGNYAVPSLGGGQGGSMARFTLINDYLYTVTDNSLITFSIAASQQPSLVTKTNLNNWGIETIFPFKDRLFIGSTSGMFIYNISNPTTPQALGSFSHVRSCDPVIADDQYAFVTLRSGTACQGFTNQLEVLNVTNLASPTLIKTYPMTNPHGLAKENNTLFICDGKDGVKVYDASNVSDLKLLKKIDGLHAYDVIAYNKKALVVAQDGLYQFNYADITNIKLLSKISLDK